MGFYNVIGFRDPKASILNMGDCESKMESIYSLFKESAYITYTRPMFLEDFYQLHVLVID